MKSTTSIVELLNKLIEDGLTKFEISKAAGVGRKCVDNILSNHLECNDESLIKLTDAFEYLNEEAIYRVATLNLLFETIESGVSISNIVEESGLSRSAIHNIVHNGRKPRGPTFDKIYDGCMAIRENQS